MRKRYVAAAAGLALAAGTGVVAPQIASAGSDRGQLHRCQRAFDAAVHEDNDAYNAKDAARYEAILNPRIVFWQDGTPTYGRDAVMANARVAFARPGWSWTYTIKSETVFGCSSGIAVAEAHYIRPADNIDAHFGFTQTLVREHGKWTVANDSVHLFPAGS
jgi:hypothetical protein